MLVVDLAEHVAAADDVAGDDVDGLAVGVVVALVRCSIVEIVVVDY